MRSSAITVSPPFSIVILAADSCRWKLRWSSFSATTIYCQRGQKVQAVDDLFEKLRIKTNELSKPRKIRDRYGFYFIAPSDILSSYLSANVIIMRAKFATLSREVEKGIKMSIKGNLVVKVLPFGQR